MFSIIIPMYNGERFISFCLDSILNQKYDDYEVIVVNDGSLDKSKEIVSKYLKDKRFRLFNRDNHGLSESRNFGVTKANGKYLLFLDCDDTLSEDTLSSLYDEVKDKDYDLIRFQIKSINEGVEDIPKYETFSSMKGSKAFKKLITNPLCVAAWAYCYNKEFFVNNNFLYTKDRYHEDFGLTPLVIMKAESVKSIDKVLYNYIIRDNSIMTTKDKEKIRKKCDDALYFFDNHMKEIENIKVSEEDKKVFRSYIANVLIDKCRDLDGDILKEYISELKSRKIYKYLLNDSFSRKIKKCFVHVSIYAYVKLFLR